MLGIRFIFWEDTSQPVTPSNNFPVSFSMSYFYTYWMNYPHSLSVLLLLIPLNPCLLCCLNWQVDSLPLCQLGNPQLILFWFKEWVGLQLFWYFKLLTSWCQLIYWIMSLLLTNLKCHFDLKLFLYLVRSLSILSSLVHWSIYLFLIINNFNYWSPVTYFNRQWLCSWTFDLSSL